MDLLASGTRNPLSPATPRLGGLSPPRSPRLSIFGGKPKEVELDTTPVAGMKMKVLNKSNENVPMYVSKVDKKLGLVTLKPESHAPAGTEKKYLTLREFSAVVEVILLETTPQLTADALSQLNSAPPPPPIESPNTTNKSPMRVRLTSIFSKGSSPRASPSTQGPNFGPGPIKLPARQINEGSEEAPGSEEQEKSENGQKDKAVDLDDFKTSPSVAPSMNSAMSPTSPRVKQQTRLTPKPATRLRHTPPKPRTYAEIAREEEKLKDEKLRKMMREERAALWEQEKKKLEEERRRELESIKFFEEQVKASEKLNDLKAKQEWQEKKDAAESKVEFLTKQRERKQQEEAEMAENSQFNANTRGKMKDEREQFEADRNKDRASAQVGAANAIKDQQRNQEKHEQMLLKNAKEQSELTAHMKNERDRLDKKRQKEMSSAKAEGSRLLKAQQINQEQTEAQLLIHGKDVAKLKGEMRDAKNQRDKELREDTDRTRKEGLEVMNKIKRTHEEQEKDRMLMDREQGVVNQQARELREAKEKEDKHLHLQSQANGLALQKTIRDTEYKNELTEQMENSKEQLDMAAHMKNERDRLDKKRQKEMSSAKADGIKALNDVKKKQEETEMELLNHNKEQSRLNNELKAARDQHEKDSKLNASNAKLEGLKALSGIKKTQEERERQALRDDYEKSKLAQEIKNEQAENDRRLKKETTDAKIDGIRALNDINKTKQGQTEKELLEKDKERSLLNRKIKMSQEKHDADLKNDLSKATIDNLRHHNDETAYNQWYRDQETLALNREASVVNEQYEKHLKKRETRAKNTIQKDRLDLLKRRREEEAEARRKLDASVLSSSMPMQAPEGSVVHKVKVKKIKQTEKEIATEAQMTLAALLAKEDLIEYLELLQSNGCMKVTDIGKYTEEEVLAFTPKIVHRRKLLALRKKFEKKKK